MRRRPPRSTRFPFTAPFRSEAEGGGQAEGLGGGGDVDAAEELVDDLHRLAVADVRADVDDAGAEAVEDRKSTRLNSSHANISYAVFCLEKKHINTQFEAARF